MEWCEASFCKKDLHSVISADLAPPQHCGNIHAVEAAGPRGGERGAKKGNKVVTFETRSESRSEQYRA